MPQASDFSDTVPSQFVGGFNPNQNWKPGGSEPLSLVVLASGHGSNLQAILDRFRRSEEARVVGVASNNPGAYALTRAREAGVSCEVFSRDEFFDRQARDERMADWVEDQGAKLIVLAGYLEILSAPFVNRFRNRIINIHPSLLPKFPGLNSIERAHEARVVKSGVTIHFVDEGIDTGPPIKKKRIWKRPGESLEEFERRVHAKEHELLPKVISQIASGKIRFGDFRSEQPQRVRVPELEELQTSP